MRPFRNDTYYDLLKKLVSNLTGAIGGGGSSVQEPGSLPTGQGVTIIDDDSAQFTWEDNASDETGYEVGIDLEDNLPDGEEPGIVVIVAPDTETTIVDGLEPGQSYFFTVQPFNDNGRGPKTTPMPFTMDGTLDTDSLDSLTGADNGITSKVKTGTGWRSNGSFIPSVYVENDHSFDTFSSESNGTITSVTGSETVYEFAGNGSFVQSTYVEGNNSLDDLSSETNGTVTSITGSAAGYGFAEAGTFVN